MAEEAVLTPTAAGVRVGIRVMPRASRTEVGGVRDGRLVIRVTAPPVDRAANDAAVVALARALHVPARSILIQAGATTRNKVVEILGIRRDDLRARLLALGA